MTRIAAVALVLLTALASCKTTDVAEIPNPGSHPVAWVKNRLLPARTVILFDSGHYQPDWKNWFVTRAVYHTRYGTSLSCEGGKRRYSPERFTASYFTWGYYVLGTAATGNDDGDLRPLFYNPDTGRFHVEEWDARDARWEIEADGWVQEGWPRLMADACPGITEEILADGGWINEKQTHPTIWKMLEQDPAAPLLLPDALRTNRTGLAAGRPDNHPFYWCFTTDNRPVLPDHCFPEGEPEAPGDGAALLLPESPDEAADHLRRTELAATLKAAHGHILEDRLGRAYVLALGNPDEFWAIDGEGHLTDVGYLTWNGVTETLDLDWELKDDVANYHHRPGDPLPVVDTGRQHPLFALAARLVEDPDDIVLPYMGRQARFSFAEGGALTVRGNDRDFGGRWLVSRGRLMLEVDGIEERAAYRWDLLANHLAATTGSAG